MIEKVVTASPTRGLAEAFNLMQRSHVDQLYIVNRNKELLGLVNVDVLKQHYQDEEKSLADIMETNLSIIRPEQSVTEVAEIFTKHNVRNVPVVKDGKLMGIITRSSMIRGIAECEHAGGGKTNGYPV